jgi:Coenzyme PQQ synthesis protein D (PqqD)
MANDHEQAPQAGGSPSREVRPNPHVVVKRVGEELLLIQLHTNRILSLNRTGARFWELLAEGRDRPAIERQLKAEFDVSDDELRRELERTVSMLLDAKLVTADGDD